MPDLSIFTRTERHGPRCTIAIALNTIDSKLGDDLRTVLADPNVVFTQVEKHSHDYFGVQIKAAAASRHARGLCSCE